MENIKKTFLIHLSGKNLEDYCSQFIMNNFTEKILFLNVENNEKKITNQLENILNIIKENNIEEKILLFVTGLMLNDNQLNIIEKINELENEVEYFSFNTNTVSTMEKDWLFIDNNLISTKIFSNFINEKYKDILVEEKSEFNSFVSNVLMDLAINNIESPMFSKAQYLIEVFSSISLYPEALAQYDKYHIFYSLEVYFNAFLNPELSLDKIENDYFLIHKDFLKNNLQKDIYEANITYTQKYNFFLYNLFRQVENNYPRFDIDGKQVILVYNFPFVLSQQISHYLLSDLKDVDAFLNVMPNGQYNMITVKQDINLLELKPNVFNPNGFNSNIEGVFKLDKTIDSDFEMRNFISEILK